MEVLRGKVLEGGEMKEKLIMKYVFYKSKLFLIMLIMEVAMKVKYRRENK